MYTPTEFLDRGARHALYSQKSATPLTKLIRPTKSFENGTIAKIIVDNRGSNKPRMSCYR
jgi:hypothetical protein